MKNILKAGFFASALSLNPLLAADGSSVSTAGIEQELNSVSDEILYTNAWTVQGPQGQAAYKVLKEKAVAGSGDAAYYMGLLYDTRTSTIVSPNIESVENKATVAQWWYRKALELGCKKASIKLVSSIEAVHYAVPQATDFVEETAPVEPKVFASRHAHFCKVFESTEYSDQDMIEVVIERLQQEEGVTEDELFDVNQYLFQKVTEHLFDKKIGYEKRLRLARPLRRKAMAILFALGKKGHKDALQELVGISHLDSDPVPCPEGDVRKHCKTFLFDYMLSHKIAELGEGDKISLASLVTQFESEIEAQIYAANRLQQVEREWYHACEWNAELGSTNGTQDKIEALEAEKADILATSDHVLNHYTITRLIEYYEATSNAGKIGHYLNILSENGDADAGYKLAHMFYNQKCEEIPEPLALAALGRAAEAGHDGALVLHGQVLTIPFNELELTRDDLVEACLPPIFSTLPEAARTRELKEEYFELHCLNPDDLLAATFTREGLEAEEDFLLDVEHKVPGFATAVPMDLDEVEYVACFSVLQNLFGEHP